MKSGSKWYSIALLSLLSIDRLHGSDVVMCIAKRP